MAFSVDIFSAIKDDDLNRVKKAMAQTKNEAKNFKTKYWTEDGYTPLIWAMGRDHKQTVKIAEFLINKGADINTKTDNGDTPLIVAVRNYRIEIVETLINKGADVNSKNNEGDTPLSIAQKNAKEHSSDVFKDILKILINNKDERTDFIKKASYENDHLKIAELFIEYELNKDNPDFISLGKILDKFDDGCKNGCWLNIGYDFKTRKKDEWTAGQCFVKGLSYYPKPSVVNWDHIVIPNDIINSESLQKQLKYCYSEKADNDTRLKTLAELKKIFGNPGDSRN